VVAAAAQKGQSLPSLLNRFYQSPAGQIGLDVAGAAAGANYLRLFSAHRDTL
jgi:hypothetical protein